MAISSRQTLSDANVIVIKIGTSSLTDSTGHLNSGLFKKLSGDISFLIKELGKKVIIVTSGAIAAGIEKLCLKGALKTIEEKQAAAAIGQTLLMKGYESAFASFNLTVSQVLLTRDAIEDRQRYLNSRNTIEQILKFGAIPIINENDTVSVEEIKVGDNDTLSALVASLVGADLLILLSDVAGFILDGKVLSEITSITKEIENAAKGSDSSLGTGGMITKLQAAVISSNAGIPMVIAKSGEKDVIRKIITGEEAGTVFYPKLSKIESRKRWLINIKKPSGQIIIDEGAEEAVRMKGRSLLPVGVKEVKGSFSQGEIVSVNGLKGKEIARGISNYASDELKKIAGMKTAEAQQALAALPSDEVIHRDNMVFL